MKVFVNGTFDILHLGHLGLLNYAKELAQGGRLLVAVDEDARVKEKKGPTRPIHSCYERMEMLRNLKAVDDVASFGSDDELTEIIRSYSPDIMVVGSDWKGKRIVGSEYAKEIYYYGRTLDLSTTQTIQRIAAG